MEDVDQEEKRKKFFLPFAAALDSCATDAQAAMYLAKKDKFYK
jgi:hypothetical protein